MQIESHPAPKKGRLVLAGLAILIVPLLVIFAVLFVVPLGEEWYSDPDAVRPWAVEDYERSLSRSPALPIPNLADIPIPVLKIEESAEGIEITGSDRDESRIEPYYERFFSDTGGTATLPDGTRLTLEAVALMLPSDAPEDDNGDFAEVRPQWVDPMTGGPFSGDFASGWTKEERTLPRDQPRLHLHVKKEGDVPLRWHAPRIFDARTRVNLASMSSYSGSEHDGDFWVALEIWHQTAVEICVPFAFGSVEEKTLEMRDGAAVEFGPAARVEVLRIIPGDVSSSEWGGGSNKFRVFVSRPSSAKSDIPQRTACLFVWPQSNSFMIEAFSPKETKGSLLHGNYGVALLEQSRENATVAEIRLRRHPRLGQAVFRVPRLPRLPEVDNLFATPIPKTRIEQEYEWLDFIARAVEGRVIHTGGGPTVPGARFPMEFENTTPGKLLEEFERASGMPATFDESDFEMHHVPPPGLWERIRKWWGGTIFFLPGP